MIVEWLVSVGTGVVAWVVGLIPGWEVPSWLTNADDLLNSIWQLGDGLEPFVDWNLAATVGGACLLLWPICLAIVGVRALISHIPFVGGKG